MQLSDAFDIFHDRISLGKKPEERIESAAGGLIDFLSSSYGIPRDRVFLQGSYPNGTAVAPDNKDEGEYDVDVVCICADSDASTDNTLDTLEATLASNGMYAKL